MDEKEKYREFLITVFLALLIGFPLITALIIYLSTFLPNVDNYRLIFASGGVAGLFMTLVCIALKLAYLSDNDESEKAKKEQIHKNNG
jgi:ABC-type enterobactin transport system permease subunit